MFLGAMAQSMYSLSSTCWWFFLSWAIPTVEAHVVLGNLRFCRFLQVAHPAFSIPAAEKPSGGALECAQWTWVNHLEWYLNLYVVGSVILDKNDLVAFKHQPSNLCLSLSSTSRLNRQGPQMCVHGTIYQSVYLFGCYAVMFGKNQFCNAVLYIKITYASNCDLWLTKYNM